MTTRSAACTARQHAIHRHPAHPETAAQLRIVRQIRQMSTVQASTAVTNGPWAHLDAHGTTQLNIAVATADGALATVLSRGAHLPSCGELLLTTSSHQEQKLRLVLLLGLRPMASACRVLGTLEVPVEPEERGLAQVSLSVCASAGQLCAVAHNVRSGARVFWVFDEVAAEAAADSAVATGRGSGLPMPTGRGSGLPMPWRFGNCYAEARHPGVVVAGRYLSLPHERGVAMPHGTDGAWNGEVVPSATAAKVRPASHPLILTMATLTAVVCPASYLRATCYRLAYKVWPASYLLACCLAAPPLEIAMRGATVIELGAGCGLPGLAGWACGARRVVLTDLPENLPRLDAVLDANGVNDASGRLRMSTAALDWCHPLPAALMQPWDFVVAADAVFWPALFAPLLDTIEALSQCGRDGVRAGVGTRVLLASTDRGRAAAFAAAAVAAGWTLEERQVGASDARTSVCELVRQSENRYS